MLEFFLYFAQPTPSRGWPVNDEFSLVAVGIKIPVELYDEEVVRESHTAVCPLYYCHQPLMYPAHCPQEFTPLQGHCLEKHMSPSKLITKKKKVKHELLFLLLF